MQVVQPFLKEGGEDFVFFHEERGFSHDDEFHPYMCISAAKLAKIIGIPKQSTFFFCPSMVILVLDWVLAISCLS